MDLHDLDFARSRLDNCVLMWGDEPIYITDIDVGPRAGTFRMNYQVLGTDKTTFTFLPNELLSFSHLPLGYVNQGRAGPIYLMRIPARQWKMGLCGRNLQFTGMKGPGSNEGAVNLPHLLLSSHLADTLKGKYPSLQEALYNVQKRDWYGCAFERHFAVAADNALYHTTLGVVGHIVEPRQVVLNPNYSYLTESLEKVAA